jgi:hypothetical protein
MKNYTYTTILFSNSQLVCVFLLLRVRLSNNSLSRVKLKFWSNMFKFLIILFLTSIAFVVDAQRETTSFYFVSPIVDSTVVASSFDKEMWGDYRAELDDFNRFVIDADSIYVKVGTPIILSMEEVNNRGFTLNDEKIFGIDKNRGLFCKVVNDTVFTVFYQYETFFSKKRGDVLTPLNKGYLLCLKERNELYSYLFIERKGKELVLKSIDHEAEMHIIYSFTQLYSQYMEGINTYIAKPVWSELLTFVERNGFNDSVIYKLIK